MTKTFLTGNPELIRDINTESVLRTIIQHAPISRAQIATTLGLTKATVSSIVQRLLDRELILEIGSDDTKKGRKPILLTMNRSCGYIVCVDLGYERLTVMVSDLLGEPLHISGCDTPARADDLLPTLYQQIHLVIDALPESRYGLVGIAVGIHGVVHHNRIIFLPYSPFSEIDLVGGLESEFHTRVILENEANLSVLGEWFCTHRTNEMLYISVHSGIGVGIIMRDQLVKGKNGFAGEFGHTIVERNGRPCPCGNRGCLEQYASERTLFAEMSWRKHTTIHLEEFKQLYESGDSDAGMLMDEFIRYMAIGINNLLNLLNPDVIVLNTVLLQVRPTLCQDIAEHLRNTMKTYCHLVPSTLGDAALMRGGIYMVQNQFFFH